MKNLTQLLIFVVAFVFSTPSSFGHGTNRNTTTIHPIATVESNLPSEKPSFDLSKHREKLPQRVSFVTQLGFIIVRRDDILYLVTDAKNANVSVVYKKNGNFKQEIIKHNISQLIKTLGHYPFYKVSRSAIVNLNEVEAYEGTRRNASLLMNDGSRIKLSRGAAGKVHDWIKEMSV